MPTQHARERKIRSTAIAFLAAATLVARADVGLPDASTLTIKGDAHHIGNGLRLTGAERNQAGAVWLASKQPVLGGFDSRFTFKFSDPGGDGNGADGLAFVIQNSAPGPVGGIGGSGGFGTMGDQPGIAFSLAVFFDTYRNREYQDPSNNSLQICINGTSDKQKWPPSRLAVIKKLSIKLKDEREHRARILYRPPLLEVYLDDRKLAQTPVDLALVTDSQGKAWVGFTASTGNGYENHDLLAWDLSGMADSTVSMVESSISFVLKACLPGKNLCTPEGSIVEEKGEGLFHVVLPAHLEWGASIPNASGRAVEIIGAHGMVCWDPTSCGGPEATLVNRNADGRTQFSIRDPNRNFRDNQGYFEFDVRLK